MAEFPLPDTMTLECSLLNTLLIEKDKISSVMRMINTDMFSTDETKDIWDNLVDMFQEGEVIDLMTLYAQVKDKDFYTSEIIGAEGTHGNGVMQLAEALSASYIRRQAYIEAVSVMQGIRDNEDMDKMMSHFSDFAAKMEGSLNMDRECSVLEAAMQLGEDIKTGKVTKIASPFTMLNYFTFGGFSGGHLVILAARPSVGKTTIAMQMALKASQDDHKVLYFSLEMKAKELAQRIIVGTGLVTNQQIFLNEVDWKKYAQAVSETMNDNFIINDTARSLEEIKARIILENKRHRCDIAFVDYLGLIRHDDRRKSLSQLIGDITGELKSLAESCDIPIVLLCQLNRESAKEYRAPQLYDLRDSGSIEQDADIVLMLENPRDEENYIIDNCIDLWLRKNRGGKRTDTDPIRLKGNDTYFTFKEIPFEPKVRPIEVTPDDRDPMPF